MDEKNKCIVCGNEEATGSRDEVRHFINCQNCGSYILPFTSTIRRDGKYCVDYGAVYDENKLKAYMYHHKVEERSAFVGSESAFECYKAGNPQSTAFLVTPEAVENWYPKTFEERINYILLQLAKQSKFIGDSVKVDLEAFNSCFFLLNVPKSDGWRKEVKFLFRYLSEEGFWEYPIASDKYGAFITNLEFQGFTLFTLWRNS